jgi:BMFP domain-containing protein YqiC
MGVSFCVVILVSGWAFDTIARKGEHDKANGRRAALNAHLNLSPGIAIVMPVTINLQRPERFQMTQTSNRFFDEIGRLMNDAAGAAQGVKREVDTVVRNQAERILRDLDLVKREEFDAVKDMARLAREENETLKGRIAALEAKLGISPAAPDTGAV